ncbi:hypothetical protein V1525DRAFT_399240 [Lipomyces kononenkoae]|uniref:Uncharacterized protein n=1 Tax=Lipomyces kononenkoae TaxID=34357 RepID=A0ACC3T5A2_LIPKO
MARTRSHRPWHRHAIVSSPALLTLLSFVPRPATASTNSFHLSSNYYIQASDNSFYKAIVSDTVAPSNSTLTTNIRNGSILQLSTPPANAAIILGHDNTIYAFYGICGSAIQVATFDDKSNAWTDLTVTDAPSYRAGSILFMDTSSSIYVFGGCCSGTAANSVVYYNTLSAFDINTRAFTQPSNSNPPVALSNASAMTTGSDTTILLGGRAGEGWIGMNQLAIWQDSSWSYRTVQNSTSVDSRTDPIVVLNGSGTKVLVSGGWVEGRQANPTLLVLELSDANNDAWFWDMPKLGNFPSLQGAVMLPSDILLGITSGSEPETLLLNTSSWTYLSTYAQSAATTSTATPSHGRLSSGSVAAISTSTVIAAIVLLVTILALVYKRRRRARPLGPLTPQSDQGAFLFPTRHGASQLDSDRASDAGSVKSWTERRKSWIKKYSDIFGPINNDNDDNDPASAPPPEDSDPARNSGSKLFAIGRNSLRSFQSLRPSSKWTDASKLTGDNRSTGDRRSGNLRGFRRRSSGGHSLGLGLLSSTNGSSSSGGGGKTKMENDDDIYELFKDREVQVLVSTTRRGKLRITNPDDDVNESDEADGMDEKSDPSLSRLNSTSSKTRWLVGNEQNEQK